MAIILALTKALVKKGLISKDEIISEVEALRGTGSIPGQQIADLVKGIRNLP
jgi:hypothetical protein